MMNNIKFFTLLVFFASFVKTQAACPGNIGSVERIVCLADSLKATMSGSQLASLQVSYTYTNAQSWSNLPTTFIARLGISLGSLSVAQRSIAKALILEISNANVAGEGYDEIDQLLLADDYLSDNGGGSSYGADLYYLCFNGTPSLTGLFSVKFGGHHLQFENTYNNGVMVGATPHFIALEPLSFTTNNTTYAPMQQEKNAMSAMLTSLGTTELATAKLSTTFSDILMGAKNNGSYKDWIFPTTKLGLKVENLTNTQKNLVLEAIKTYVLDMDSLNAQAIILQYEQELDDTYIAYSGTTSLATKNDYVRIDGPGVWIEFSVQNGVIFSGVHYHSIWRDHLRDYGGAGSANGVYSTSVGLTTGTSYATVEIGDVSVFPNPATDFVNLKVTTSFQDKNISIVLYDALGRKAKDIYYGKTYGDQLFQFDISNLNKGVYFIELLAERQKKVLKIIKQ